MQRPKLCFKPLVLQIVSNKWTSQMQWSPCSSLIALSVTACEPAGGQGSLFVMTSRLEPVRSWPDSQDQVPSWQGDVIAAWSPSSTLLAAACAADPLA